MENKFKTCFGDGDETLITPFKAQLLAARVTDILREIGVPANLLGYRYAKEAIIISVNNSEAIHAVSKVLYPAVAKTFATTPSRVERDIRHAIKVTWNRGNLKTLHHFFGYTICNVRGKPTNSEFIAAVAERLSAYV